MGTFSEYCYFGTIKYKIPVGILCVFVAVYLLFNVLQPSSLTIVTDVEWSKPGQVNFFDNLRQIKMRRRTQLVKERCSRFQKPLAYDKFTYKDIPPRPLVSDRFEVIGCKAAKVASTNLQRIFYILNGGTNETDTGKVNKGRARKNTTEFFLGFTKHSDAELISRFQNYTKFMFVRHPLERLVSAYRDQKPNGFFKKWRKEGKVPNFSEFIDHLLEKGNKFARPVEPLNKLCKPCPVRYEFVGSLDDFDDDITTILSSVGAEDFVTVPKRNETGYNQKKSSTVVADFYKDIPRDKIKKIENIYIDDYFIFGFDRYSDLF